MTSVQLAQASNAAVYATMVTLAIAMVCFAVSLRRRAVDARRSRRRPRRRRARRRRGRRHAAAEVDRRAVEPGRRAANIGMSLTWLAFAPAARRRRAPRASGPAARPGATCTSSRSRPRSASSASSSCCRSRRDLRWLGLFVVIPMLLTLGLAVTVLYTEAAQLVPALKSYWLVIHVSAAIICFGAFTRRRGATAALSLAPPAAPSAGRAARPSPAGRRRLPTSRAARRADLPHHRVLVPAVDLRGRRGRDLGRERLGPLLGLGPEGDLGVHHLGRLRRLPARPRRPRAGRAAGASWIAIAGWVASSSTTSA